MSDFIKDEIKKRIHDGLKRHFRPEFLNRVDEIIVFNRLGKEDIAKIVGIQIGTLKSRLRERNIALEITQKAKEALGTKGYDPVYGARPLKRVIQKEVQDPIALKILKGELKEGKTIKVDAVKDELAIISTS